MWQSYGTARNMDYDDVTLAVLSTRIGSGPFSGPIARVVAPKKKKGTIFSVNILTNEEFQFRFSLTLLSLGTST